MRRVSASSFRSPRPARAGALRRKCGSRPRKRRSTKRRSAGTRGPNPAPHLRAHDEPTGADRLDPVADDLAAASKFFGDCAEQIGRRRTAGARHAARANRRLLVPGTAVNTRAEGERLVPGTGAPARRLELDHVLIAVVDLAEAADEFEVEYGLASVEGGRHPGWGTANRIVPLGETYLELVALVDQDEAAKSDFGRWVASVDAESGSRPFGWAVRTNTLDEVARRLGRGIVEGSRVTPEGQVLRWRAAALEQPALEPSLPFFIAWAEKSEFPVVRPSLTPPAPSSSPGWTCAVRSTGCPAGSAGTSYRSPCARGNPRSNGSSSRAPAPRS